MKIYVSHSGDFDYQNELYTPLRNSPLNVSHEIILPHEKSNSPFNSKELLSSKECDLVLAEVSYPATGVGVELGWASAYNIPIMCMYRRGQKVSASLGVICDKFIEYENAGDMIRQISMLLEDEQAKN